jgi:hypothetical protein
MMKRTISSARLRGRQSNMFAGIQESTVSLIQNKFSNNEAEAFVKLCLFLLLKNVSLRCLDQKYDVNW